MRGASPSNKSVVNDQRECVVDSRRNQQELTKQVFLRRAACLAALLVLVPASSFAALADQYLTGFSTVADPGYSATVTTDGSGHPVVDVAVADITTVLGRIPVAINPDGEGCDLTKTSGNWNCANFGTITLDVQNCTDKPVLVCVEILDSTLTGWRRAKGQALIGEWATKPVDVQMVRDNSDIPAKLTANGYDAGLFGLQVSLPGEVRSGWNEQNLAAIKKISVVFPEPCDGIHVKVKNIRATDEAKMLTAPAALLANEVPMMDQYGQHRTADGLTWTYKVSGQNNFDNQLVAELDDMVENPPINGLPANIQSSSGGWRIGPARTSTGSFRTEKINGRWWFVDPDGDLFWSFGINAINISSATPYSAARSELFAWVPASGDPLYQFFNPAKSIDFAKMNAYRKYGTDWDATAPDVAKERLFNWRMNTAGAWSDRRLGPAAAGYAMPYTVYINLPGTTKVLNGAASYSSDVLPDVFDASFASGLAASMATEASSYGSHTDRMCVGYFVLNEVPFANGVTVITSEAFKAPATAAGKTAMVNLFKTRYANNIASLNAAWGTAYASWTALSAATVMPAGVTAADLQAFSDLYLTNFYQKCRAGVKATAPTKLYLGSRINVFSHPNLISIAAQYCDVLSFNVYHSGVGNLSLPAGVDKPILISEFHFGSIGTRGSLGGGLCPTRDINLSAALFGNYMTQAILHPGIVGAHWFCYQDQSLAGRSSNGENNRIGFISVTDFPYAEMVNAARTIGSTMYAKRYGTLTYEDCFIGGNYALDGRVPGPSGGTWTADTAVFQANGVIAATGTDLDRCAYLPFTPVAGKIYKASVRIVSFPTGATNRLGVGFFVNPTVTKTPYNSRGALTYLRAKGGVEATSTETYDWATGLAGQQAPANLAVILDTRAAAWKVQYQVNDVSWKTNTFTVNPAINAMGLTRDYHSGGGTFDNFVLEVLPQMP